LLKKRPVFDKKLWIGLGISAFFLYVLFREVRLKLLLAAFSGIDYRYLLWAVACTLLGYYLRAIRWKYLLAPLKKTSMNNLFPSTIIGYMANNLLPARLGELVRAYVLGEKEKMDKSSVFATLVLDRLMDGFTVLILLVATLLTLRLPEGMTEAQKGLEYGGYLTVGFYFLILLALVILKIWSTKAISFLERVLKPLPERFRIKAVGLAGSFVRGIRFSSQPGEIMGLFASSLLMWALAVWTVDLVLLAFHIDLPLTAAMFILVLIVFAIMVPSSPGFVGTYHAACMIGLMAFNFPKEKALSVALVMHAINFLPVTLLGLWYLIRDKISLRDFETQALNRGDIVE
jgi:uncharacterized protein (TIRG00374 family)